MTFDLSQVVTPEDLAEQMETLTQRLDAGETLVLFQNNRPRFWLVGLEHLPQCSQPVPAGSAPTVAPKTGQDVKIGTLVRTELGRLCRQNALSAGMLQNLCNTSYCKQTFHASYAILKPLNPRQSLEKQCKDTRGYNRYYHTPYTCNGQRFLLSNTWYERQRPQFLSWLASLPS